MTKYIIEEKQNLNSYTRGDVIEAKSLTSAKRIASNNKVFIGTVLVIRAENGNELCYKKDGKWSDFYYEEDWA